MKFGAFEAFYLLSGVVVVLMIVVGLSSMAKRDSRREADQRAKCLADGGRIVPVHGGKYDAWICDLPRNVEVQP